MLALAAVLASPLRADAQTAGSDWAQGAADAQNTNRAVAAGPSDPGLRWVVDLEDLVTDEAPSGYTGGGASAVHSPIIGAGGEVVVPVTNPDIGGRRAFVALDPATGEVAWEIQRRANLCAPAIDSQGRMWAGMNFDYDDLTSNNSLRAFDADGQELEDSFFDLGDLGVANPGSWCSFSTALHIGGTGDGERLVLFYVGSDNVHIAGLDISGTTPTVAWQIDVEQDGVPFDRFVDSAQGGRGGGPSGRLAAMTDDQLLVPVTSGEQHQLAFLSLATGEVERLVDLPVSTLEGEPREIPPRDGVNVMIVDDHAVVAMADRSDYLGVLHGIALNGTSTTPDWTAPLPSDSRSVSGGEVMAISGSNVVVPSLGRLQAHDGTSGAAAAWSNEPETTVFRSPLVTDADGAIYTTYRPVSSAINLVRYSANGRLDWQLRRTTLLGELDVTPDAPDELRVGPIDGDGTLYVRMGSTLYALDNSGGLADCEIPFDDVAQTNTHAENICRLVQLEITGGTSATTYSPRQDVSRAQMASFLANAAGLEPVVGGSGFTDVDPNNVHTPRIYAVRDAGITTGRTDTTFDPNTEVRRDQMASFIIRLVDYLGEQG